MPILLAGVFDHSVVAIVTSIVAFFGFARREPVDYYREHVEGRVRHPARYALRHPIAAIKRARR